MSNRRIARISFGIAVAAFLGAAFALVAAAGLGLGSGGSGASGGDVREIRLEARGMAFYLPGDERPNPTLRVAPGERVRLVLENRDPGMRHDLALPALDRATTVLESGRTTSVVIRAPERPGSHEYLCSLHPVLMRGVLRVR